MAYKHGNYGSEVATSIVPMTEVSAGLPVVFGTAPIHLASDPSKANSLVLCYSYSEAVTAFGYSDDWEKYTLCEFMKSHFALFNLAPVIFVNVLDAEKHKISIDKQNVKIENNMVIINDTVILNTLKIKVSEENLLENGVDYTAGYNDDEQVVITILDNSKIAGQTEIIVNYDKINSEMVTKDDIIGGIDIQTGEAEGLELINEVYPKSRLVPGLILAPGWSCDSEVAAIMKAKCTNISGHFKAICLCDADTETLVKYSDVPEWKNNKNYVDPYQIICWPKVSLGGTQYHLSTQLAGVICRTDSQHDDIPYWSPSNQSLQADSAVLADGREIYLDTASAAYLNGQGVVTALNFIGGWTAWGNRTTAYPSNTDVKDAFIPIRRMFNWVNNTLITTFWHKIDNPINKRLIETIVDSANIWLNGLSAKGALLGGRVEFRTDENPTTDLLDGIIRFHVFITPPSPARDIEFIQEYDPDYISTLFY